MAKSKEKVWILFSVANDYNQPEKAFEKLWWHEPTLEDVKEFGFNETDLNNWGWERSGQGQMWIETFEKE